MAVLRPPLLQRMWVWKLRQSRSRTMTRRLYLAFSRPPTMPRARHEGAFPRLSGDVIEQRIKATSRQQLLKRAGNRNSGRF